MMIDLTNPHIFTCNCFKYIFISKKIIITNLLNLFKLTAVKLIVKRKAFLEDGYLHVAD